MRLGSLREGLLHIRDALVPVEGRRRRASARQADVIGASLLDDCFNKLPAVAAAGGAGRAAGGREHAMHSHDGNIATR